MSIVFSKPPLIEAICQFQFASKQPWDSTIPGLIYAQIREEFPIKEEQGGIQLQFLPNMAVPAQFSPVTNRVLFKREDGSAVVQIGPNFLAVNHLLPYTSWELFEAMILKHLNVYQEIARPETVVQLEMRFINRLEIPLPESGPGADVAEYTNAYPHVPDALLRPTGLRFVQRVEIGVPESQGVLVIQSATLDVVEPNQGGLLLDLSFTRFGEVAMPLGEAPAWLRTAHDEVERAFLACITPLARENFGEVHNA